MRSSISAWKFNLGPDQAFKTSMINLDRCVLYACNYIAIAFNTAYGVLSQFIEFFGSKWGDLFVASQFTICCFYFAIKVITFSLYPHFPIGSYLQEVSFVGDFGGSINV